MSSVYVTARLLCFVIGHREGKPQLDPVQVWVECERCGATISSYPRQRPPERLNRPW